MQGKRTRTAAGVAALAVAATSASAQYIEIVPSASVVEVGETFDVSVFVDRDGATEGFFSSFQGWSHIVAAFEISGPGQWVLPTESNSDDADGSWYGRRPSSDPTLSENGYGSFRDLGRAHSFLETGGRLYGSSGQPDHIELYQAESLFTGTPVLSDDRVELFRAQVTASAIGQIDLDTDLFTSTQGNSIGIFFGASKVLRYVPVEDLGASVDAFTRGASITIVPTPGSIALLAPVVCLHRRRR